MRNSMSDSLTPEYYPHRSLFFSSVRCSLCGTTFSTMSFTTA